MYAEIAHHADHLNQHPLMKYFTNNHHVNSSSFAFVPKMAFFVLGFKDILATAYTPDPQTSLDKSLNTHCEEDSHHWKWFLEDLDTLSKHHLIDGKRKFTAEAFIEETWSSSAYVVRQHTYDIISLLSNGCNAEKKLLIIECLEAAFSVFITNLTNMTQRAGLYNSLRYFGREHHMDEAQHSMGSWLEGNKEDEANNNDSLDVETLAIINTIFLGFNQMFDYWFSFVKRMPEGNVAYAAPNELDLV